MNAVEKVACKSTQGNVTALGAVTREGILFLGSHHRRDVGSNRSSVAGTGKRDFSAEDQKKN